jgi:hypothetical protein
MTERLKPYELLVDLASFDAAGARPGDWLNLHAGLADLARLVGQRTSTMILNTGDPRGLRAVAGELGPIVRDLHHVVRGYVAGESDHPPRITVTVAPLPTGLIASGGTRDVAIFAAVLLLRPGAPVRACPEPGCGRLFVRSRRQLYCSRRCVMRANMRQYRAALAARAPRKPTTRRKTTTMRKGGRI